MGIKYFFSWIKNNYPNRLKQYTYLDKIDHDIDILGIDINGLIHNSAQRIYKYGNYKQNKSFLNINNKIKNNVNMNGIVYKDVCESIDKIVRFSFPKKKLILCIDGVAPRSKQNQQRSRRFRAIKEKKDCKENKQNESSESSEFDGNCISPGTRFMDGLSNYIEIFIHKKISNDMLWQNLKVVFASEKTPGEGEHNIVQYFKKFADKDDILCLHGMDADLFMLGLSCHNNKNFHILRESNNNTSILFDVDVKGIREDLCRDLIWKHKVAEVEEGKESKRIFKCQNFSEESLINDFIFMCFSTGNDFLPHIPSIEILNNGLNIMFDTYREIASNSGHLTTKNDSGDILINKKSVKKFFEYLGTLEKTILQEKVKNTVYFKDEILENNTKFIPSDNDSDHHYEIDIKGYKNEYYNKKVFGVEKSGHEKQECLEKMCVEFYRGLQWVLTYYTKACVDYEWYFPYHYSPFLSDLAENTSKYSYISWKKTKCREPFKQLLAILPEESNGILPMPLRGIASSSNSVLGKYYPNDFEVDMAGFKNSWEGVAILPFVDSEKLDKEYLKVIGKVDRNDMRRNEKGFWKQFQLSDFESVIKLYNGNFNSKAEILKIDFE